MRGVRSDKHEQLHILYFNATSLYPKLDELLALCDIVRPEVVCITKTWLCDEIGESEFSIPGYSCVRCDTIGTDMVVELHCLSLTSWNIRLQCVGQEFLLVPVHNTNNVNEKVYLAYATGHQLIQLH